MRSRTRGSHRDKVDPGQFSFMNGHNEFDPADKSISVSVLAEIGDEKHSDNLPFHLRVELVGHFAVMDDKFDASKIEIWAEKIAPLILYPYVREHVYSLTLRAGFTAVVLPLIQVPSMKKADLAFFEGKPGT